MGLSELPAIPANPPTSPPTKAVTKMSRNEEPPSGNNFEIFSESKLPLLTSIHVASTAHNKKMPRKPARKPEKDLCGMKKVTTKAMMATLHQSRKRPAKKAKVAINKVDKSNFIFQELVNEIVPIILLSLFSSRFIIQS